MQPTSPSHLDQQLSNLAETTGRLRVTGFNIVILTAANVLLFLISITALIKGFSIFGEADKYLMWAQLFLAGGCTFLAVFFEVLRHQANALFEEISDELQWHRDSPNVSRAPADRPELSARVILRAFAKAAELPFFPGNFGPLVCIVLNIAMLVALLVMSSHMDMSQHFLRR